MKIELKEITVRELTKDYQDNDENGVTGFNGKLDIRPPYQREFIYKPAQRDAVIDTVTKDFPLNVIINEVNCNWMLVIKNTPFIYDLYNKPNIKIKFFDKSYNVSFMNRNDRDTEHLMITNY